MERYKNVLLRWWFLFCGQISIGIVAYYLGFFHHLLEKDPTRLGFIILTILILTTLWLGNKVYSFRKNIPTKPIKELAVGWFIAETCLVLGLVGTVTGFIFMLSGAFIDLDVSDVVSVQAALVKMSLGMSTALYTTLMGLLCSLAIKVQLVNIERQLEKCV